MPGQYEIDEGRCVAILTISGMPLSWGAFVSLVDAMIHDPAFRPGMPVLEDLRTLAQAPGSDCMRAMAGLFLARPEQLTGTRWAMVVRVDQQALYGVGRMAEAFADGTPVTFAVFKDWDAAQAWVLEDGSQATAIA